MGRTPADPTPGTEPRPGAERAALAFVLLTLATLLVVPFLVERRVTALREDIAASEPARTLVTRLRFDLVREMAALSELVLGGTGDYSQRYAAALADERATAAQLEPLAERLGPEVSRRLAVARELSARWHERVADDEIVRRGVEGGVLAGLPRESELFEEALEAMNAVDEAILAATDQGREQIATVERRGLLTTFLLGLLAIVAAGAVGVLYLRAQRFAAEAERRREQAEAALEESARQSEARVRLLRGITHDVKNPLGAAKGYAELLSMGIKAPIAPEQAPLVEGVQRSVDDALAIIADLLDVARADSGGLSVRRVPTELDELTRNVAEGYRAEAEAAGLTIRLEAPAPPVRVHTDPARVRQVLGNLLSNAVKYTPAPGEITVRVEVVHDDPAAPRPGVWAAVRVSDSGPGVPPELREAIFDEFTRLDEGSATKGHGLGLAIARRIARLLGGDLRVDDTPGPGASFCLWIPCREPAGASGPAA